MMETFCAAAVAAKACCMVSLSGQRQGFIQASARFYTALSGSSLPVLHEGHKHHGFCFSQWMELSRRLHLNDMRVSCVPAAFEWTRQ